MEGFRIGSKDDVAARIRTAVKLHHEIMRSGDPGKDAVQEKILGARKLMSEAWAIVQRPVTNEFRGFWAHNGDGIRSRGGARVARWKDAIPMIHRYGFNAIFPNVLWSGVAFYPSRIVPVDPGVASEGDYLQEIIDAAKPLGVEVHPWKVMWQLSENWLAQPGVGDRFRAEHRMQVDSSGRTTDWLCPSDPRNRRYELDAILELARYDIQGIHLDYIRYAGDDVCFCDGCRERFSLQSGRAVTNWPADVLKNGPRGGEYGQWKRDQISSFVKLCHDSIKAVRPDLELSAAVFPQPDSAKNSVYQDWALWAREGWLDFVCTMTYTADPVNFRNDVSAQLDALEGTIPLYPGLMVLSGNGDRPIDMDVMTAEVLAARELGACGFMFFELRDFLQDYSLPYLAAGLTRTAGYGLRFREVPENQRPAVVAKGTRLKPKGRSLLLDDFEDNDTANELGTSWDIEADQNGLGTVLNPSPLALDAPGAEGSKHCVRIWGHMGASRAPWPYAALTAFMNPEKTPVDLGGFTALEFWVKGDGKSYEVCLDKKAVRDYAHFRLSFPAPASGWTKVVLPLDRFSQPDWGKTEEKVFSDVTAVHFRPARMDDEDFDLSIDDVRLVKLKNN